MSLRKQQEWVAHGSSVNALHIARRSGSLIATGGDDKRVNVWAIGKPHALVSLTGHTSAVECVAFDASEEVVVAGSSGGTLKIWDPEQGKVVRTLTGHRASVGAVDFHPFGEFFASGSEDRSLRVWDVRQRGCVHALEGHSRAVCRLAFSPDGRWIVSGGQDGAVKLWDLAAGKVLHDFPAHAGAVTAMEFHPREFLLATASADRRARLWDLETWALVAEAGPEPGAVRGACFSPCGSALLLASQGGGVSCWGWEPSACHHSLPAPWAAQVADMHCTPAHGARAGGPGRLVVASVQTSFVTVWVGDLGRMPPWAQPGGADDRWGYAGASEEEDAAAAAAAAAAGPSWARPELPSAAREAAMAHASPSEEAASAGSSGGSWREGAESPPDSPPSPQPVAAAATPPRLSINGSPVLSPSQLRRAMRHSSSGGERAGGAMPAATDGDEKPSFSARLGGLSLIDTPPQPPPPPPAAAPQPAHSSATLEEAVQEHERVASLLSLRLSMVTQLKAVLCRGNAASPTELGAALRRCAGDPAALAGALRGAGGSLPARPLAPILLSHLQPLLLTCHAEVAIEAVGGLLREGGGRSWDVTGRGALAALLPTLQMLVQRGGAVGKRAAELHAAVGAAYN